LPRIALSLQYIGSDYSGWQRQREARTIQSTLEDAIFSLSSVPTKTFAAGRTDSGVHAAGQVVHFDSSFSIPPKRWASALNGRLPESISVRESILQSEQWHACFSAKSRKYRYLIYNSSYPDIFLAKWSWHRYHQRLDEEKMNIAIQPLLGIHDFAAFQKAGSTRRNSITEIKEVSIKRIKNLIAIDITATGFLYGMVRLIVGQLVAIGEKKLTPEDFYNRWNNRRRDQVLESAPAKGLCFLNVGYSDNLFSLKSNDGFYPFFLEDNKMNL
tara:strand:- start:5333 stop:6145 length:813 start_codon:yes stop_codon:yes gene_type:complete